LVHSEDDKLSNKPKVSVIIPCHNDGKYIDYAIRSIVKQTYHDWEIIIVDDGSTDLYTIDKLKNLNYPKTTVLRKNNGGVSSARNYGIRHSKAEYLLLLDADDSFKSTFIEKAVRILDNNEAIGVVSCYERFFREDNFENTVRVHHPKGGGVENFLTENNANGNSLIRYQCWRDVGGYDEKLPSHEDWDFWIKVTSKGWLVYTIPEVLFHYRRAKKSKHNKNVHRKPDFVKRIVENNIDVYRENVVTCLYEKEKEIQQLKEDLKKYKKQVKSSSPYIVGYYVSYPFRKIKKVVIAIKSILSFG
jgi:glycosyltransferase involved in cell wall biosynthesis